jgi:hypothetical protein
VTTPTRTASNDTAEEEAGGWTIPLKHVRTKGKNADIIGSSVVPCVNEFEAIGILKDSFGPFDRGP